MRLLKEADELNINQNIDYAEEFKHTLNSFDLIKLFKNFFKSVNFKGYNEQEWNKFVDEIKTRSRNELTIIDSKPSFLSASAA